MKCNKAKDSQTEQIICFMIPQVPGVKIDLIAH